jgi:hypothetical protein
VLSRRVRWTAVVSLTILVTAPVVAPTQELQATGTAVPELRVDDRIMLMLLPKWQIPGGAVAMSHEGRLVFANGSDAAPQLTDRPVEIV